MSDEKIMFPSGGLSLEGRYAPAASGRGVVVAHPHPLMGGSLDNIVVETIATAFGGNGYASLRFNFRGVGRSGGSYDGGEGEQADLLAAADFLAREGVAEIVLAGYSFGAWVIVQALRQRPSMGGALLISPPIDLMAFDFSGLSGRIAGIIAGDGDPYCDAERLRATAARIGAPVKLLAGADHFFSGREGALLDALKKHPAGRTNTGNIQNTIGCR